jgi:hypothetical protein
MDLNSLPFIPGLELSTCFYHEGVRPVLDRHFPQVPYAAARLDFGSDVLGFDTPLSRDHGWGPKVTLFLTQEDFDNYRDRVAAVLAEELPLQICGYPTNYDSPFSGEAGMVPVEHSPVNHWVAVTTIQDFCSSYLGVDNSDSLEPADWLVMPQQHLRTIACGRVFHDGWGALPRFRKDLQWYPHDLWLYLLANQWRRIDQEEPFLARCGDAGDELGSQLIAARMVGEIMRLCFLMEQQYTPYSKWFGTAFQRLSCAPQLSPVFQRVLDSKTWWEREISLSEAYRVVMKRHNALGLTPEIEAETSPFYSRPYQVPHAGRFVDALHQAIQSQAVRALPRNTGSLDQFVHSSDLLSDVRECRKFRMLYL